MLRRTTKPAAAALLLSMAACTSLQPVAEPNGFIAQKAPSYVVVSTNNEEYPNPIVLNRPQVDGNSLTGTFEGEQLTLSMNAVRQIRAVQPDRKKTLFALVGGTVLVGAITYLAISAGDAIDDSPVCVPGGHRGDNPYCSGYDGIR